MINVKKLFVSFLCSLVMLNAHAGLIVTDGSSQINGSFLSLNEVFEDFYGYDTGVSNSSDTGFEQDDTLVLFVASYMGEYAIFGLLDAFRLDSGVSTANLEIVDDSSTLGELRFVDDAAFDDFSTTGNVSSIQYRWQGGKNDGFIYEIGDFNSFDVSFNLTNLVGVDSVSVLGFDGASQIVALNSSSTNFRFYTSSEAVDVPEPSFTFALAMLLIVISGMRRRFR